MASRLFTPGKIGSLTLRNRIIKSATFEGMAPGGVASEYLVEMHRQVAAGGTALTVVGFASVHRNGRSYPHQLLADTREAFEPLRELTDKVHQEGGAAALQLVHCGRSANPQVTGETPIAPSPVRDRYTMVTPKGMTEDDINEVLDAFARAAGWAKEVGFDAVQLHGAHGYLISQFLSAYTNRRDDDWGGDPERRRHFVLEAVRRVRQVVGDDFPVFVKINTRDYVRNGVDVEEAAGTAQALALAGVDAIELSGGFTDSVFYITRGEIPIDIVLKGRSLPQRLAIKTLMRFMEGKVRFEREAYFLDYALQIRPAVDVPLILVGGMRSRSVMEEVLEQGMDFVSMARPLIREPDLPLRMERGETEKATCISCNRCLGLMDGGMLSCYWERK